MVGTSTPLQGRCRGFDSLRAHPRFPWSQPWPRRSYLPSDRRCYRFATRLSYTIHSVRAMSRGHIRQRGDRFELRVSAGINPDTGARRTVTRTVDGPRAAAEKALTRLLTEIDAGAHQGPDATLGQLLDRWWAHGVRKKKWGPATRRGYATYRRAYLADHHDRRLQAITPAWLDDLYDSLLGRLAPATVRKVHNILHDALDDAVRWGWLAWNPADRAEPPAVKRRPVKVPDRERLKTAVATVAEADPDWATFLLLQAAVGPRMAELVGLRWGDLRGAELTIARTVVVDEHGRVHVQDDTKTHRARTVILGAATLAAIEAHRLRAKDLAAQLEIDVEPGHYLFPARPDQPDQPRTPGRMQQRWRRWRDRLDLAGVKPHAFRHAMVTHLLDQGVEIHDVAARAGHASANVTWAMYTHPGRAGAQRAGDAADL